MVVLINNIQIFLKEYKRIKGVHKKDEQYLANITDKALFDSLLKKDSDGWMYVDFLSQSQEFNNPEAEYKDWVNNLREVVNNNINNKDVSVRTKYMWLAERIKELGAI